MITRVLENRKTDRRKKKYTFPCYNTMDSYRYFRLILKENKEGYGNRIKQYSTVNREEYHKITSMCNEEFASIILEGASVPLPYKLGTLLINKRKNTYTPDEIKKLFDYKHYNETKEKQFITNDITDYTARWFWTKKECKVMNKRMYSFTPARANIKSLVKIMKEPFGHTRFLDRAKRTT